MDDDKRYVIRPVIKEEPKAFSDEVMTDPSVPQSRESSTPAQTSQASPQIKPRHRMQFSQIPTERIIKTLTNKDMMMQTLHDETMEPHIHLAILLFIVIVLAIIISLLGL